MSAVLKNPSEAAAKLQIIGSPVEDRFDYVTALASRLFEGSQTAIVFHNGETMWAKSTHEGLQCSYSAKESLCGYAVTTGESIEVEDASLEERFAGLGAIRQAGIRFYANRLLRNRDGVVVGSFCVRDTQPRVLTKDDIRNLDLLGGLANELVLDFERAMLESGGVRTAELSHLDFTTVFTSSPAPMWLLSEREQVVVEVNPKAVSIIGRPKAAILGECFSKFSSESLSLEKVHHEMSIVSADGTKSVLLTYSQKVTFDGENYLLVMADDITIQVERSRLLEKSRHIAESANRAKSDFLARMSHELRTPLNAILGFSQLMAEDGETTSKQAETLDIINSSGEHLLTLINDVLEMSKIESGKLELKEEDFCLNSILEELNNLFVQRAESHELDLRFNRAADLPSWIHGDPGKLRQILVNLIGNSLKFTQMGGIRINSFTKNDQLHFEVIDTGIGISESELGKLFKAFSQTEAGTKASNGTGLGLAISKKFVELMGGEIAVKSKYGDGSTFSFWIPLRVVPAPSDIPQKENRKSVVQIDDKPFKGVRVLVADDQFTNRLFIKTALVKAGCEVIEVSDGREALEEAGKQDFDCIFMDVRMPEMDGLTATKKIRENHSRHRDTPIIAVTGNAFQADRDAAVNAGCTGFLAKPVKLTDLYSILENSIDSERNTDSTSDVVLCS